MSAALQPVLLVDDSPEVILCLKRILTKVGVSNPIITFDDGSGAITFLEALASTPCQESVPRFVFTDINMKQVSGWEFTRWFRGQPLFREVKLIMMTACPDWDTEARAKAAGVDQFFRKFPPVEQLAAYVSDTTPRDWAAWESNSAPVQAQFARPQ